MYLPNLTYIESAMDQGQHFTMRLNNYLAQRGELNRLDWELTQAGPQNNVVWTAVALIDQIEYGRGQRGTIRQAKEDASEEALNALYAENAE